MDSRVYGFSSKRKSRLMKYHQLTSEERYALSALRKQGFNQSQIARALGRHRSTISREIQCNSRADGGYRPYTAHDYANGRRSRSRRNWQFADREWQLVRECLQLHPFVRLNLANVRSIWIHESISRSHRTEVRYRAAFRRR